MRRWLPSLPLAAGLAAFWLLLNDSVSPPDLLVALLVALVVPPLVLPLKPAGPRLRRPMVVARLIARVGREVVHSGLQVGASVLRSRRRASKGAFVRIPLDLRDPHGLAALAMITTVIPGTVWCELAPDASALLLHVFDLQQDEAEFVAGYKAHYEQPLKEVFG